MKLLIVEDEADLARDIVEYLSNEKYVCEIAGTFEQALDKIVTYSYDCVLLDLMLPGGNGMTLLEELKKQDRQDGVIIISARNSIDDKVTGLKIGADDYLSKPFHLSELAARVHSVIRRKQFHSNNVIHSGELKIDFLAKTVSVNDHPVPLTKKELDLLLFFIDNKNRVISRNALAEHLSGDIANMLDNHDFVYAHIKNLKKKLHDAGCDAYLKTVYGTGYKWEMP
ncbi:MAG TPA: response regulator transcription factor [Bacteroidia bacterium]|nr:response regulator transcription factor [Bacteroidia bacterium]